jgi:hypothetical protein
MFVVRYTEVCFLNEIIIKKKGKIFTRTIHINEIISINEFQRGSVIEILYKRDRQRVFNIPYSLFKNDLEFLDTISKILKNNPTIKHKINNRPQN